MNLRNRIQQYIGELKQAYQAGVVAQAAEDLRRSEELLQTEHPRTIETWRNSEGTRFERELEDFLRTEPLLPLNYSRGLKGYLFTMGQIRDDRIYKVPFLKYLRKGRVN